MMAKKTVASHVKRLENKIQLSSSHMMCGLSDCSKEIRTNAVNIELNKNHTRTDGRKQYHLSSFV